VAEVTDFSLCSNCSYMAAIALVYLSKPNHKVLQNRSLFVIYKSIVAHVKRRPGVPHVFDLC
jgi:hypothetical protein